jgi:hypothetical protein
VDGVGVLGLERPDVGAAKLIFCIDASNAFANAPPKGTAPIVGSSLAAAGGRSSVDGTLSGG